MRRWSVTQVSISLLLFVATALMLFPFYLLIGIAIKSSAEFFRSPLGVPLHVHWENFTYAWIQTSFPLAFMNSAILTCSSVGLLILVGASAAFTLARGRSRLHHFVYMLFLAGMMVPFHAGMIPLYQIVRAFHLVNSYYGVVLIFVSINLPLVIFIYTRFINSVPRELEEAALLDGCSSVSAFWRIIFPLLKPATATVAIFTTSSVWNDFIVPLLFLQSKAQRPLPVALFTFVGEYNKQWPSLFAALILAGTPLGILFVVWQPQFMKGLTAGGLKG